MRIVSRTGIGKNPGTVHHLDVSGSSNFDSQVFFQNTAFFNAGVELGDTTADLISVNGRIDTNIEPSTTVTRDFGSSSLFWNNTYSKNLIIQNDGSIESNGNTINLGTVSATTINIGRAGATVNIYGSFNKIQSTDTEVFDKLVTLNKNGLVSSATGSGIEIEENAVITAYTKTSSDRNQWLFKSPNKSGIISLEPGSSAFTHKILSEASADRVWTLPDNTDTFVGTTNSQIIENKTLNNTIVTGDITITGRAIGVGFIPIGGVIAIMPNLTGSYNCTATTAADSYGFVRCGFSGQVGNQIISDATSPMNGQAIPRINNDVFLMGNVTSGIIGGSNSKSLTVGQIPQHSHTMDHDHPASGTGGFNARHNHGADDSGPQRYSGGSHDHDAPNTYRREGIEDNDNRRNYFNKDAESRTGSSGVNIGHDHDISVYWQQWADGGDLAHAHSTSTPARNQSTGNTGSTASIDFRPSYISTVYIMRIK